MMGRGYGYGYNMMGGYNPYGGLLIFLFAVLLIVAIALLVVWAVKASRGHESASPTLPAGDAGHDEAVAIAKRRLASGEITPEQYQEILRTLGG